MEDDNLHDGHELRRPLGMTLLSGLYLFFFLLTASSYGQPIPFMGAIYQGTPAQALVIVDSVICLYLLLGIMKCQRLTWYVLLGYNVFEVVNTLINLLLITSTELEKVIDEKVDISGLVASNIGVMVAIILLSGFIFRQRGYFSNRSKYLF